MSLIAATAVAAGLIAFGSDRDGAVAEVFVMRPDGSAVRQLTHSAPGGAYGADFSPDGRLVAVSTGTVKTDGSGPTLRLYPPTEDVHWAPDGRRLSYLRPGDEANDLVVASADGGGERWLTGPASRNVGPRWSPDGSRIVVQRARKGMFYPHDWNISVVNVDGSGITQLTHVPERSTGFGAGQPDWSPDGRRIAFVTDEAEAGTPRLAVMNADGTGQRNLTPAGMEAQHPVWSPDGTSIAFIGRAPGSTDYRLAVIAADGGGVRWLDGPERPDILRPVWSPDGRQLAYTASDYHEGEMRVDDEVFVVDADGGEPRQLTHNTASDGVLDWSRVAPSPPAAREGALVVRISRRTVRMRRGAIGVRLRCPAAATAACRGRLILRRHTVTLGSKRFAIAPGQAKTVKVRLSRRARRAIRRAAPTRIAAVVRSSGLPARKVTLRVRA